MWDVFFCFSHSRSRADMIMLSAWSENVSACMCFLSLLWTHTHTHIPIFPRRSFAFPSQRFHYPCKTATSAIRSVRERILPPSLPPSLRSETHTLIRLSLSLSPSVSCRRGLHAAQRGCSSTHWASRQEGECVMRLRRVWKAWPTQSCRWASVAPTSSDRVFHWHDHPVRLNWEHQVWHINTSVAFYSHF